MDSLDKKKIVGWNKFTDNRQTFREGLKNGGNVKKSSQITNFTKNNWLEQYK